MSLTDDPDFQALMRRVALMEARLGWATEETTVSLTGTERASLGISDALPVNPRDVNVNPDIGRTPITIPVDATPVDPTPVTPVGPAPAG